MLPAPTPKPNTDSTNYAHRYRDQAGDTFPQPIRYFISNADAFTITGTYGDAVASTHTATHEYTTTAAYRHPCAGAGPHRATTTASRHGNSCAINGYARSATLHQ